MPVSVTSLCFGAAGTGLNRLRRGVLIVLSGPCFESLNRRSSGISPHLAGLVFRCGVWVEQQLPLRGGFPAGSRAAEMKRGQDFPTPSTSAARGLALIVWAGLPPLPYPAAHLASPN